ncbi:MAG: glycosyltransferase family 39 protein [Ignavibacteriae bacterium]|nr:glycosyltransferase family 39 protein [Ignavibacteriota bacterium]
MNSNIISKYPVRKLIILLFVISFIVRLSYGLYYFLKYGSSNFSDDWAYIKFAEEMLKQGVFVPDISGLTQTKAGITPFYPLVIYLSFKAFGINYLPLVILNAVFSSSITILIYYIGMYSFNNTVGLLSSAWSILYINYIRWVPNLLKENLVQFLFALLILLLLIYLLKDQGYLILAMISIVFTVLIHTDERYMIYYLVLVAVLFLTGQVSIRSKVLSFIFLNAVIFTFMLPWLIRNYEVYHRPVILSERTAFITDRLLGYKNENYYSQEIQLSDATLDSIVKGQSIYDMTMYNIIQRGISYGTYPKRYSRGEKMYIDFKELWRPFRFSNMWVSEGFRPEGKWSMSHNLSLILSYGILLPFFLTGIYFSIKTRNVTWPVMLSIVLLHTIIHITFVLSQNRYRIPIDVIIIVTAFYGLTSIYENYRFKRKLVI